MEEDRRELHSGLGGSLIDAQDTFMFGCPYLGTLEDTDTSLSFPAQANHCFRTKTPASVELAHQETYCLTDMHPGCHIFHQTVAEPPETKKRQTDVKSEKRTGRASIYALPLILILLFLAAILWWPAPGTVFEEAIAFGSQLRGENDKAVSNDVESGDDSIVSPASDASEPSIVENQTADSNSEAALDDEDEQPATAEENSAAAPQTTEESIAQSGSSAVETVEEDSEAIPSSDIEEAVNTAQESTSSINNEDSIEIKEAISEEGVQESVVGASAENADEDIAAAIIESAPENEEADDDAESSEAGEANENEEDSDLALLISGLPVLNNLPATQTTAVDQPAAAETSAGVVAFIGPDSDTPLALRDENDIERALFVRESPFLTAKLLTIINRRQQATILGQDSSGAWLQVRLETGVEGWVNANASQAAVDVTTLPVAGEAAGPAAQALPAIDASSLPVMRSAIVNTGALNLRSGPSVAYEPITTLNKGEIVGLIGRRGSVWVRIRLDSGLEGWVNASLLAPLS